MSTHRSLPIPFVVLILAGIVSLFSLIADRGSRASTVRDDSIRMQTVEQERMADFYFRILSWLSDLTPRTAKPAKNHPQSVPAPHVVKSPRQHVRQGRVEFCLYRYAENLVALKLCDHRLN